MTSQTVTPARMPARRPVRTWTPPADRQVARNAAPARAQASPDNARARRLRRNGWHA
jgi:hypothetical protein